MTAASEFAKLYDRPVPHSAESEMQVIGAMMIYPETIPDVSSWVVPEDFYAERHAEMYRAIVAVADSDPAFEPTTVLNTLRDTGKLSLCGGREYMQSVMEGVVSSAGTESACRQVADYARLRRLMDTAGSIMHAVKNHGPVALGSVREILDRAEADVFSVAQDNRASREAATMGELMQRQLEEMRAGEGERPGVATGFTDLDRMTLGLHPGEMIVIAARPSMGKSAFAAMLTIIAGKAGVPVGFFSLEMNRNSLAQRWLAGEAGVDSHKLRSGHVGEDDLRRVTEAVGTLSQAPVFVDDTASLTVLALRAHARRMVARHKVRMIVVDYLQLLTAPEQSESRQLEVAAISRGLKALAREAGVPVVVLSQLNRQSENRTGNRPRMSDLRDSGAIEQDADVVMLLHREGYYHQDDPEWASANPDRANVAEVIVAKQRNGPVGTVYLTWVPSLVLFRNYAGPARSPFDE